MKLKFLISSLSATALMFCATGAHAALTAYTTLASFGTATTATATDTFTGFSITGATPGPLSRTVGPYSYSAAVSTTTFYGAGTSANPYLSTNTATDSITFSAFTGGVSAIGGNFFTSNIAGAFAVGGITLTATDSFGATASTTIDVTSLTTFYGFTTTGTISSLVVSAVQPATPIWPTVDNFVLGQVAAVPEPETYALMFAGLGLVGFAARKKARRG